MERVAIEKVSRLIDQWCERRELKALAYLLPTMTGVSDVTGLVPALRMIRAEVDLPAEEERVIDELILTAVEHR